MTYWAPIRTATNAWSDLDHARHGFWDEFTESASVTTTTATATIGPATTLTINHLLDATIIGASASAVTYGAPVLLSSVLSAVPTTTSTRTLTTGLEGRLIQLVNFTLPVPFNAVLAEEFTATGIASFDTLLNKSDIPLVSSYDALLSAAPVVGARNVGLDSILLFAAANKLLIWPFDGVLERAATTRSAQASFDVSILRDLAFDIGAWEYHSYKASSLDANLLPVSAVVKFSSLDAILSGSAVTTTQTLSFDGALLKGAITKQASIDGLLSNTISRNVQFDARLEPIVPRTSFVGFDAFFTTTTFCGMNGVLLASVPKTVTLNAVLDVVSGDHILVNAYDIGAWESPLSGGNILTTEGGIELVANHGAAPSVSFDAITKKTSSAAVTLSTSIAKTFEKSLNIDALMLAASRTTNLQSLDAIFLATEFLNISIMDAVLLRATGFNTTFGMNAALLRAARPFVSMDAQTVLQVPKTGADAVLVTEVTSGTRLTLSTSMDSILTFAGIEPAGADAVLV